MATYSTGRTVTYADLFGAGAGQRKYQDYGTPLTDVTPPSVPTNLRTTAVGPGFIGLAWDASTDDLSSVVGYEVFRNNTLLVFRSTTTYTDVSVVEDQEYSYTVRAKDGVGLFSAQSAALTVTAQGTDEEPPDDGELEVPQLERWSLFDPVNGDSLRLLIGPESSPGYYGIEKNVSQSGMDWVPSEDGIVAQPTFVEGGMERKKVSFSGRAVNAAQYLHLQYWYDKGTKIILRDDLGFEWALLLTNFESERELSASEQWYFRWTLSGLEL